MVSVHVGLCMFCIMQNTCNRLKLGGNYVSCAVVHKLCNLRQRASVCSYDSCVQDRFMFLNSISRLHCVINMVCVLSDVGT
jgi:hypothetical protein